MADSANITRRNTFKAALALAVATPTATLAYDPLLEAVEAFREGNRRFCALPEAVLEIDEDAAIAATYGPPLDLLSNWQGGPAATRAGAIAAMQTLIDEGLMLGEMGENLAVAVLGFLEKKNI